MIIKTALCTILLAGAVLSDMPDSIALVQERDARTVRIERRDVTQAQPINPPTAAETAAVQMSEAAKIVIPANLKVSRRFMRAVQK